MMGISTALRGAMLLALMTTPPFAAARAAASPPPAAISNVATLSWEMGGSQMELTSNRVDLVVERQEPTPLVTYKIDTKGDRTLSLEGSGCVAAGNEIPFTLEGVRSDMSLSALRVTETHEIHAGEPLVLEIRLDAANRDPAAQDRVTITLKNSKGDEEQLVLVETESDSGRFVGIVATRDLAANVAVDDCSLAVVPADTVAIDTLDSEGDQSFASSELDILADPFGLVFDSAGGAPISGVTISIVDADTGAPAEVFGEDGVSRFPSTVVTGSTVTDSGGQTYAFPPGDYRFPLMRPGHYRLIVDPPAPYLAPSTASPDHLAGLRRSTGQPFAIVPASFGGVIVLDDLAPVRVDIPLDGETAPIQLRKTASRPVARPGDLVQYRIDLANPHPTLGTGGLTVTDRLPVQMRLRPDTLKLNGRPLTDFRFSGSLLTVALPPLEAAASVALTYVLEVRADARPGDVVNRAEAIDERGRHSNVADAVVRIARDAIADRMTIVGRVADGGCAAAGTGVGGIRIMLEDGSYTVTDDEGRYHFEGVTAGLHVVQLDDMTLPADRAVADCAPDSRSAGRAFSRFVEGQGGILKRVDFRLKAVEPRAASGKAPAARAEVPSDAVAAGSERDWLTGQEPGIAWLFPEVEHNPRAPVVRVAIKHLPGQSVRLFADGKPVDPIAFEGTRKSANRRVAVSLWRGIALEGRSVSLSAEIRDAGGALVETLRRDVHYAASPMRAELIRDQSILIADGVTRPVIAVRLSDRDGRPVHHGLVGDFEVPAPYYPAVEADAQQARHLAGLERARPVWHVEGEEGIAYVALEPTTASGTVTLRFKFRDGETVREQRVEAWLDPGDRPWTIVGLAEGTLGYDRLDQHIEDLSGEQDDWLTEGRLALYAKGRISGQWLMTLAYDSDKDEEESRFGGVIDPTAYYTVYADRSERRYDASSVRRLYLKLERPQFYALFGDYDTGLDEPELARYVRAFNGLKAEYRSERVSAVAFAADTPNRHRRDEIQGNGLTGPYVLGARDILANSERIVIEVRDRLRSDRIVETRLLARHIDYDIDYVAGTLRFREPILSRTSGLDPQFIVADYEVNGVASRSTNAGGRASWRTADQTLQVSATAIHNEDERASTNLGGADMRYRPSPSTEIHAEVAISDHEPDDARGKTATAWQVEAEHHGSRYDLLAYARERESGFGIGQLNASENGTRKFGLDGRARLSEAWSLTGSAWHEDYLNSGARRLAGSALVEYRGRDLSARAGLTLADDRLADGRGARSTLLQLGATKRLLDNRLELDAQTEIPLHQAESIDFPARHRLGARYSLTGDVQLIGAYEIANGETTDARTARIGFDVKPWAGARIAATANVQDIAEYGPRSFAAYGLAQSLVLDEHWSIDVSLDGNRTLGGIDPDRVLNPLHPVASGGFVADGSTLTEDFTAVTAGATYRADLWSITGRAEYRAGDGDDRYGLTLAALRQIGEGSALGGAFNWFTARAENGAETRTVNLQASWAHRPAHSAWSFLDKLELREDSVVGAVAGVPGPVGVPLTVTGDARSRRMVNALSINWSPHDGRTEAALFWGARYVADRFGADDIKGWSHVVGADIRFDLSDRIDIGAAATVRQGVGGDSYSFSGGPSLGLSPFENGWMSIGWNLVGFHDRDFEESRYTRTGPYVTMRLKFDQLSLQGLGLGRR